MLNASGGYLWRNITIKWEPVGPYYGVKLPNQGKRAAYTCNQCAIITLYLSRTLEHCISLYRAHA